MRQSKPAALPHSLVFPAGPCQRNIRFMPVLEKAGCPFSQTAGTSENVFSISFSVISSTTSGFSLAKNLGKETGIAHEVCAMPP